MTPEPVRTVRTLREFEDAERIDDGYDFLAAGEAAGWRAIAGWGCDGWDLGDWPYVVILFRDVTGPLVGTVSSAEVAAKGSLVPSDHLGRYERATYCEGDITIETYASAEDRQAATDETAFFYWRNQGSGPRDLPDDFAALPDEYRGPYRTRKEQT